MKPLWLALPGSEAMAAALSAESGAAQGTLETRRFPDGETYLRIHDALAGRSVALVCSLDRPDPKALGLCFAADAARELGAARVGLVAPYLAYMRQDTRFHPGEAITSRSFAALLSERLDWLVTVDPHLHRFHALDELYRLQARVVHAAPALADWIRAEVRDPVLVGPDEESAQWVADVAARVGAPWLALEKRRRGDRQVEVSTPDVAAHRGRTPVVLDDIVSSARTMAAACRALVAEGLPAPVCVGVHGLFAGDAEAVLRAAGAGRIVTTDTVPHASNGIALAARLWPAVAELAGGAD